MVICVIYINVLRNLGIGFVCIMYINIYVGKKYFVFLEIFRVGFIFYCLY